MCVLDSWFLVTTADQGSSEEAEEDVWEPVGPAKPEGHFGPSGDERHCRGAGIDGERGKGRHSRQPTCCPCGIEPLQFKDWSTN